MFPFNKWMKVWLSLKERRHRVRNITGGEEPGSPGEVVLSPTHVVTLNLTPIIVTAVEQVLVTSSLQGASCRLRAKLVQTVSAPPEIVSPFCLHLVIAYDRWD